MKKYLIPILLAGLVVASSLTIGCSQSQEPSTTTEDKASWTEKQVIDYLYEYLVNKTEQLQEARAQAEKIIIGWGFQHAVLEAFKEVLDEGELGELVYMQFGDSSLEIPTWVGALKKLAKYNGDGLWSVSISDWEWQVNERTGEVKAQNNEAAKLLGEITHETYRSTIYGYYLEYPVGWTVTQVDGGSSVLIVSPEPQLDMLINQPYKLQTGQSLGEVASGFASFLSTTTADFQLIDLVQLWNGDYRMDYEWMVGGTRIYSRAYFVLHNSGVYIVIIGSAPKSMHQSYLTEFDYAYNSFRFY